MPNITAKRLIVDDVVNWYLGGGAWYNDNWENYDARSKDGSVHSISFDASRCSPIYGNSNTVQPKSLRLYPYIHI